MMRPTVWFLREPVRVYLYGVAAVVVMALVFYGVFTDAEASLWLVIAGTVLGVPVAVEQARSKVSPTATPPHHPQHLREDQP